MTIQRTGSRLHDATDLTLGVSDAVNDRTVRLLIAESKDKKWTAMATEVLAHRAHEKAVVGGDCGSPCTCKAWEEAQA